MVKTSQFPAISNKEMTQGHPRNKILLYWYFAINTFYFLIIFLPTITQLDLNIPHKENASRKIQCHGYDTSHGSNEPEKVKIIF
jgi:hypothetical protein